MVKINLETSLEIVMSLHFTGIGHEENPDVDNLPDAIPRGQFKPVKIEGKPSIITFDIETTDLSM